MFTANIHDVKSIELISHYPSNSDGRTIRIMTDAGERFEFTFFGSTGALGALPHSGDFRVSAPRNQEAA